MGIKTETTYTCDYCNRRPMLSRGFTVAKVYTRPAIAPTVLGKDIGIKPDVLFFCSVRCIVAYYSGEGRDDDD